MVHRGVGVDGEDAEGPRVLAEVVVGDEGEGLAPKSWTWSGNSSWRRSRTRARTAADYTGMSNRARYSRKLQRTVLTWTNRLVVLAGSDLSARIFW